jgi:hypothetical protein
MDHDDLDRHTGDVFRDFAAACRAERDRIALARLAAADRHFESARAERARAETLADHVIAAARR